MNEGGSMRNYILFIFFFLTGSVLLAQPSPVIIVFPQDGSTAITNPVNFVWNKSPLALAYTIQISTSNLFTSTIVTQSISDTTYSSSILQTSTNYYWRVRAENLDGASGWTTAMFTTKLKIPTLLHPSLGDVNVNPQPTLSWSSVFSSAKYTVQLSVQPDFTTISQRIDQTDTTVIIYSLIQGATYYWRVGAYMNGDTTSYSSPNFFTTAFTPVPPNLIYPTDGSTNIPVNGVLRWSRIQNAISYKLQISTSPIFFSILKDSSFTDTLYRPKPFFNSNTQYFWRVNSTNSAGTSNYSSTYRFTTGSDTIKAKLSIQNNNLGIVKAGTAKDAALIITNTGNDDLIIDNKPWGLTG